MYSASAQENFMRYQHKNPFFSFFFQFLLDYNLHPWSSLTPKFLSLDYTLYIP